LSIKEIRMVGKARLATGRPLGFADVWADLGAEDEAVSRGRARSSTFDP
jgi:hypothetical protein